jgi:hypothetical protein
MRSNRINSVVAVALALNYNVGDFSVTAFSLFPRGTSYLNSLHSGSISSTSELTFTNKSLRQPTNLFSTKKLSRPERKALEREKKAATQNGAKKKKRAPKKFELHSNNVSELTINSTADDVVKAIKR